MKQTTEREKLGALTSFIKTKDEPYKQEESVVRQDQKQMNDVRPIRNGQIPA